MQEQTGHKKQNREQVLLQVAAPHFHTSGHSVTVKPQMLIKPNGTADVYKNKLGIELLQSASNKFLTQLAPRTLLRCTSSCSEIRKSKLVTRDGEQSQASLFHLQDQTRCFSQGFHPNEQRNLRRSTSVSLRLERHTGEKMWRTLLHDTSVRPSCINLPVMVFIVLWSPFSTDTGPDSFLVSLRSCS